jgi:hypothetical protein
VSYSIVHVTVSGLVCRCTIMIAQESTARGNHPFLAFHFLSSYCQATVKDLSRTCQGPVKDLSRTCQGPVKDLSRSCQGPVKDVPAQLSSSCRRPGPTGTWLIPPLLRPCLQSAQQKNAYTCMHHEYVVPALHAQ